MEKPRELTFSSISLGIIIGIIMTAANVYLGLYAGMTVSASIPAAVIAMGVYGLFKRKALLESNIVQTMASAGESLAAGIIFTLPALIIVGAWNDFEFWPTTLIGITGGLLGVIFMIPLRRALIIEEKKLTYPEGVACAAVLKAGVEEGEEGRKGFLLILKGLVFGGIAKFLSQGLNLTLGTVEYAKKLGSSSVYFGMDISPALLAVGYIIKLEVAILVLIGGLLGFSIAIPLLGTPEAMESLSALDLAWGLWGSEVRYLGVGAMIVGGVFSIISVRKGMVQGIKGLKKAYDSKDEVVPEHDKDVSLWLMMTVLLVAFVIMLFLYKSMIGSWGFTFLTTIIMGICSFLFVAVSSYIVGLVGSSNNPVSGMTISALLVSAALFLALGETGHSGILSTLGVAAIVCCAACTAGDCSQDLKTGSLLQATPRNQQIAEMIGIIIPAFVIAPVLTLLHHSYGIGTGLKAPQATLFASITQALFGEGSLPYRMVILGAILGVVVLVVDHLFLKNKKFRLHLMPLAVGIYLPVTLAVPIFIGGFVRYLIDKKKKSDEGDKDKGVLLSSGFIAGEAIMGVLVAILIYNKLDLSFTSIADWVQILLSLAVFFGLTFFLYKKSKEA